MYSLYFFTFFAKSLKHYKGYSALFYGKSHFAQIWGFMSVLGPKSMTDWGHEPTGSPLIFASPLYKSRHNLTSTDNWKVCEGLFET